MKTTQPINIKSNCTQKDIDDDIETHNKNLRTFYILASIYLFWSIVVMRVVPFLLARYKKRI